MDRPIFIAADDQMLKIVDPIAILSFGLDEKLRLRNQCFQSADLPFIAAPDRLIGENQNRIFQMGIESAEDLIQGGQWSIMSAEQFAERMGKRTFACSLFAAKDESCRDDPGLLDQMRQPFSDIDVVRFSPVADDVFDMIPEKRAIALNRFDGEPFPNVEISIVMAGDSRD